MKSSRILILSIQKWEPPHISMTALGSRRRPRHLGHVIGLEPENHTLEVITSRQEPYGTTRFALPTINHSS